MTNSNLEFTELPETYTKSPSSKIFQKFLAQKRVISRRFTWSIIPDTSSHRCIPCWSSRPICSEPIMSHSLIAFLNCPHCVLSTPRLQVSFLKANSWNHQFEAQKPINQGNEARSFFGHKKSLEEICLLFFLWWNSKHKMLLSTLLLSKTKK